MAQLPSSFNPSAPGQEGVGDFKAINPGDYKAQIVSSQMKPTNAGTGEYLELVWSILEGDNAGRKLWSRLNLINPTDLAVEIAQKHLTSICVAVGVPGPISDSAVLHGKPCMIKVVKTAANAQYPEGNEVKNYMPLTGADPATALPVASSVAAPVAPAPAAPAAEEAPPVGTKPPWLK